MVKKAVDIRIRLQATSDARILHPLHKHVLCLLPEHSPLDEQGDMLSPAKVAGLNTVIAQSTVLCKIFSSAVLGLSENVAVKIGGVNNIDYNHISTLEYINKHAPDVPTPVVYGVVRTKYRTYLFMSRISGESLDKLWPALDEVEKISVQDQLTRILKSLRAIPRPPLEDGKLAFGGGHPRRCKDLRRDARIAEHPISNEEEFNEFLLNTDDWMAAGSSAKMLRSSLRSDHRIVMTHSDLHPRNIMVVMEPGREVSDRDAKKTNPSQVRVVALIDWEACGWYPEYWEYTKALSTVFPSHDAMQDWRVYLPTDAIGEYPEEFAIDMMIDEYVDRAGGGRVRRG